MTQELIKMVRRMDLHCVGNQLIFQCAPLIVGLRISSLLMISNENMEPIRTLLQGSRISYYLIYKDSGRTTLLLFSRQELESYLSQNPVKSFLESEGYDAGCLTDVLWNFRINYGRYKRGRETFPHELGVILGYPIEDVKGYILDHGKRPLYTGYWKVYCNVSQKRELFRMFELSREMLLTLLHNGIGVEELIGTYCGVG